MTPISAFPDNIQECYEIHEWRHASAILKEDFPAEWDSLVRVLAGFTVRHSHIVVGGGERSEVTKSLDGAFYADGWQEKKWETKIVVDQTALESPTHKVDCVRNGIAVEIEWSNKDPFFDRDLNNFRLLFDLRAISVGVIITKSDELGELFRTIHVPGAGGRSVSLYRKYGASTTWMSKLIPRIEGGGGGGCPILVFGITKKLYRADL
jgi:hypothetical protein